MQTCIADAGECTHAYSSAQGWNAHAVASGKVRQRRRATRALQNHTINTIQALKEDDDEMLRGA